MSLVGGVAGAGEGEFGYGAPQRCRSYSRDAVSRFSEPFPSALGAFIVLPPLTFSNTVFNWPRLLAFGNLAGIASWSQVRRPLSWRIRLLAAVLGMCWSVGCYRSVPDPQGCLRLSDIGVDTLPVTAGLPALTGTLVIDNRCDGSLLIRGLFPVGTRSGPGTVSPHLPTQPTVLAPNQPTVVRIIYAFSPVLQPGEILALSLRLDHEGLDGAQGSSESDVLEWGLGRETCLT